MISDHYDHLIISDGLTLQPYIYKGIKFIPQQINRFLKIPFGTITYCLHPNTMNEKHFNDLKSFLDANSRYFTDHKSLRFNKISLIDKFIFKILNLLYKIKN